MKNTIIVTLIFLPILIFIFSLIVYILLLLCKALKTYIKSNEIRKEKAIVKRALGEILKEYRTNNLMTQEFVAESLGVSRQAVSKWENGTSDPSTSNLISLAKLYRTSVQEILNKVNNEHQS